MSALIWIVGLSLLVLTLFFGLTYFNQDRTIFQTKPLDPQMAQRYSAYQQSFEHADGTRLHGWFRRHPDPNAPLLIYYGGNAEEISWNLDLLQRLDVSVLLVNYRGYGASQGEPSETALKADALWLLDKVSAEQQIPLERIFVMGRSLGSGIAAQVAHDRAIAGAILITPYDSFVALAASHYPGLPLGWLMKHRFESDRLAPRIEVPMLNLLAGRDRVVPPKHGRRLAQLWKGEVETLEFGDADHINITDQPGYWPEIGRFIANRVANQSND